jgi:alpha-ketoglutarate-dependent taurine dioxygenase
VSLKNNTMELNNVKEISGIKMLLEMNEDISTVDWAKKNNQAVEAYLSKEGALLVRGLKVIHENEFGDVLKTLIGEELLDYTYRSTPRTELKNKIYTATEYHPSETIPQHNENAYANVWPMRIGFLCVTVAQKLGNTPISDSRLAYQKIPKEIRDEFESKKVMYVRNYSDIDLPWTEVFQTENKLEVEDYCKKNDMDFEWTGNGLKTKQVNQAVVVHPVTKDKLWFNQAHLFHVSSLSSEVQEGLIEILGEDNLPRNAYYGDGTPIDTEALELIRKVYSDTKITFQWQKNDLLLLDNMLFTHGREPFEGPRKILVGMGKAVQPAELVM